MGRGPVPDDVRRFLEAGPPPVVMTYGSSPAARSSRDRSMFMEAAKRAGVRLLVPGVDPEARSSGRDAMFAGAMDFEELLPHAAALVHHGGAGTTYTALAAGIPAVVVPHLGDQPYYARRVEELGAGVGSVPRWRLTGRQLARLVEAALDERVGRERREEVLLGVGRLVAQVVSHVGRGGGVLIGVIDDDRRIILRFISAGAGEQDRGGAQLELLEREGAGQALAEHAAAGDHILCTFAARRQEVYAALFVVDQRGDRGDGQTPQAATLVAGPDAVALAELAAWLPPLQPMLWVAGDGAAASIQAIGTADGTRARRSAVLPNAASVARLGRTLLERDGPVDLEAFEPMYLKEFVAKKPKRTIFDRLPF